MDRRLAVTLAADIVGCSAQMERDEAGRFDHMTERRRGIFEPEFAHHQGPTDPYLDDQRKAGLPETAPPP